jgi:hypothetical protein
VTGPPAEEPPAISGNTYLIDDFYHADGSFSALGLALEEKDFEKSLTVGAGDIIIVGGQQYRVTADSLALSFYTQPSLDSVVIWWTDYLNSLVDSGKAIL